MSDSQKNAIDYFRLNIAKTESRISRDNKCRAIESFTDFTGDTDVTFCMFNEHLLEEWAAYQLYNGYYPSTVSYNIKKLGELYNKAVTEGLATPLQAFASLQKKLNDPYSKRFGGSIDSNALKKLRSIVNAKFNDPSRQLARDMLLFAIFNGGLTYGQIASYKKNDYVGSNGHVLAIINKYSKPRNKYLFPLNQSHSTPRQMTLLISRLLELVLSAAGVKNATPNTPLDLWCSCAMSCGVTATEIAACIGTRKSDNAITAFVVAADIDDASKESIKERVITELTANPLRWFAMHLRPQADFKQLEARINERGIKLNEIYYPMEEILRKVGKRKYFESRPVISWLVFFQTQLSEVEQLSHDIHDIAWIYRQSSAAGSPYSIISDTQISNYKMATGVLGPDTELLPDNATHLNDGDYVIVLGGITDGRHGIVKRVTADRKNGNSPRFICSIRLSNGQNLNWIVNKASHLVRKITPEQFNRLEVLAHQADR